MLLWWVEDMYCLVVSWSWFSLIPLNQFFPTLHSLMLYWRADIGQNEYNYTTEMCASENFKRRYLPNNVHCWSIFFFFLLYRTKSNTSLTAASVAFWNYPFKFLIIWSINKLNKTINHTGQDKALDINCLIYCRATCENLSNTTEHKWI